MHRRPATPSTPRHRPARRRGFTLIEASLTTVIVGTGVLAMMEAQQAYHRKNAIATRAGTGQLLANELRELMNGMPQHENGIVERVDDGSGVPGAILLGPEPGELDPSDFDDLDDFSAPGGLTFNPPISALGRPLPGEDMARWRQSVSVSGVDASLLELTTDFPLGTTDLVRVSVVAEYDTDLDPVNADWIRAAELSWLVTP